MQDFHPLLLRQLRKQFGSLDLVPESLYDFLDSVSKSYSHYEEDNQLLDRAMVMSNDELLENNRILERKNEMLDAFVYRVSHDLKTPTTNIQTMLGMFGEMQKEAIDANPMLSQIFNHIQKSADLLQIRIADLLEMSRMENALVQPNETIDLLKMIESVKEDLSLEIETSAATIDVDVSEAPTIISGRENIFSLLSNLLSNSIKYRSASRQPKVEIKTYFEADFTVLRFSDNGMGIDLEKNGNKLFGMFNRFHNHVAGTGVGLYIVKKIIENAGGKILVESELEKGTTFYIHFANVKSRKKAELNSTY